MENNKTKQLYQDSPSPKWSIVVFSSRESLDTLSSTLDAAIEASYDVAVTVDVVINGNKSLAEKISSYVVSKWAEGSKSRRLRIWFIDVVDKAHAWNTYVHKIWSGSEVVFFVDGYVHVMPNSFKLIDEALGAMPQALGASGVPSVGSSARRLRKVMLTGSGGIHGNLYSVRGETLRQLRERDFRLPLGIYRTDPLLGAVMYFNLDPANNAWDGQRIYIHPQATWRIKPLKWNSLSDIRTHIKRVIRQAQGVIENLAIREFLDINRNLPENIPRTASELCNMWLKNNPIKARLLFIRNPLTFYAIHKMNKPKDWSKTSDTPQLITEIKF